MMRRFIYGLLLLLTTAMMLMAYASAPYPATSHNQNDAIDARRAARRAARDEAIANGTLPRQPAEAPIAVPKPITPVLVQLNQDPVKIGKFIPLNGWYPVEVWRVVDRGNIIYITVSYKDYPTGVAVVKGESK